jgi:niacin transporter
MLAGRVLSGIAKALIFMPGISMTAWIMASFVTALPGILIQLVFLPSVVMTLMKAKIIPVRYAKGHSVV